MNKDDAELVGRLKRLWEQADPPPSDLVDRMVAAVAAADLDTEYALLLLVHDSVAEGAPPVRGLATARVLSFGIEGGPSLEVEVDGDEVRGQLLDLEGDMGALEVVVESVTGRFWSAEVDEFGFFAVRVDADGAVRIRVGDRFATEWVDL